MQYLVFLILFIASFVAHSQPNPQERYPGRIRMLTEQLRTDSLNYNLIWERLEMQVNLLGSFPTFDELLSAEERARRGRVDTACLNALRKDFVRIEDSVIRKKHFDVVAEGDFYLNRTWFYYHTQEFDKAIADAFYLRDSVTDFRYWGREAYYNTWACFSLLNLYVVTEQYDSALVTIDRAMEEERGQDPKLYYVQHTRFQSYRHKIRLYEKLERHDELIAFLKQLTREHFDRYFEMAAHKDADYERWSWNGNEYYADRSDFLQYTDKVKDQSFRMLQVLVSYLKKYESDELPVYEKIYHTLRYQKNENYETIRPDIRDRRLKKMVEGI